MSMRPVCSNCVPAHRRRSHVARVMPPCLRNVRAKGGVYVPSDSFGGQSPERKAAGILRTFFTFVAARVVLAQLEGSGRGALGAYDSQASTDLHHFLQNVPMKDGDEWLAQIMRQNTSLGLRLMEVRDHYCEEAFEWDQLQRLAKKDMKGANTKLMRQFAAASLAASLTEDEAAASSRSLAGWRTAADTSGAATNAAGADGAVEGSSASAGAAAARDPPAAGAPTGISRGGIVGGGAGSGETAAATEQLGVVSCDADPEGCTACASDSAAGAQPTGSIEPSAPSNVLPADSPSAAASAGLSQCVDGPREDPPPACRPPMC